MSIMNSKTVICPNCQSEIHLSYGWEGMGNSRAVGGKRKCQCGLVFYCDWKGNKIHYTTVDTELLMGIKPKVDVDAKGVLVAGIEQGSLNDLQEHWEKLLKIIQESNPDWEVKNKHEYQK